MQNKIHRFPSVKLDDEISPSCDKSSKSFHESHYTAFAMITPTLTLTHTVTLTVMLSPTLAHSRSRSRSRSCLRSRASHAHAHDHIHARADQLGRIWKTIVQGHILENS